jgi:hypothetical protein
MITLDEYHELIADRVVKVTPEEVGYEAAPEGSALRCAGCLNYYRRSIDNFAVCQIMRSEETDVRGVHPDWRCQFFTVDDDVFPLYEEGE